MKGRAGTIAAAAMIVAITAGSAGSAGQFKGTVATVGGDPVTAAEVRAERDRTDLKHGSMGLSPQDVNAQALEVTVRRRLVMLDVKKRTMLDGPLGDRMRAITNPAYARSYRKARIKEVAVTDVEVNLAAPTAAIDRRRVSYIVTTAEKPIREAHVRALAGEDFAALAREYSEGPGSEKGGDLGWLEQGQNSYFTEEQWAAIYRLPKGGVTGVFPSLMFDESWVIARVDDIERYSPHEVEEMRKAVRQQLRDRKVGEEIEKLVRDARLSVKEEPLGRIAQAGRGETVAAFDGGSVTAGAFRAYLERMKLDPAQVDAATLRLHLKDFAEQAVIATKKEKYLLKKKGFREGLEKATNEALVNTYIELLYAGLAPTTDAEVERAYREDPDKNLRPAQVELWQIRLSTKEEADEAYQRLMKGEDFESVAVLFAATVEEGKKQGFVGLLREGQFPEPLGSAVFSLKLMEVGKPIAARFGYFIHQVRKIVPEKVLTLQERQEAIRVQLLQQKKEQAFSATMERLKNEFKIKVDDAALQKI